MFGDIASELKLYSNDNGYLRFGIWQAICKVSKIETPDDAKKMAEYGIEFVLGFNRGEDTDEASTGQYL